MRHLSALTVEATFDGVPACPAWPGVKRAVVDGRHVSRGPGPDRPLVEALAGTGVRELLSREPSLEELFLAHYGPTEQRRSPPARARRASRGS